MNDVTVKAYGLGHAYSPGQWVFRHYGMSVERGSIFSILGPFPSAMYHYRLSHTRIGQME